MNGTVVLILLGALIATGCAAAGVYQLFRHAAGRRASVVAAEFHPDERVASMLDVIDRRLVRTRPGAWLARELDLAGSSQSLSVVGGVGLAVAVVGAYLLASLAPLLAVLGLVVGYVSVRTYLRRSQQRRREAFLNQLPELARVLANASQAGLSLPTAIAIAGDEMAEPARSELQRVATRLSFGAPVQSALDELQERIGSRETNVLTSVLVVSSRSGGSLVSALRDVALTLDDRKETRRAIRSTLSQAVASANISIFIGFAILVFLNVIQPGTVDRMTREPIGQIALLGGGTCFAVGWLVIRRMSRIDV